MTRWIFVLTVIAGYSLARSEPAADTTTASAAHSQTVPSSAAPKPEHPSIQHDGLKFILQRSTRRDSVETEEYFLENESVDDWSQMLTYQRIVLPEPIGTDQYVASLKAHLEQGPGFPRVRAVQSGRDASIFGVQFPKSGTTGEQFALALVTVPDRRRPSELHIVQFVIQAHRLPVEEMELQVKRWQARFQSQVAGLSRAASGSRPPSP